MNSKSNGIIKNFSYSFASNITSLLISTIVIAIVPKLIGVTEYGYYQLYVFYASYIGFFHFGWCDGIYLKYGGIDYNKYDKKLMSSQFWYLSFFELLLTIILFIDVYFMSFNGDKNFILMISCVSIVFVIPKTLLSYLLQISNRIKEYSIVIVIEKVIYCLLTIFLLLLGCESYEPLIIADIVGKLCALALGVFYCKDIVFNKMTTIKISLVEAWDNITIGIKLLVANVAGMLILGIVRMGIEKQWDISTFGKISLVISISNLLMVFINAIGVVLFPVLKRMNEDKMIEIYVKMKDLLMIILFGLLILYYPIEWILSLWLPNYAESFHYMSILFPMCIYESKMSMLLNTYLKALRKEKQLLIINCTTVILSALSTYVCVYILKDLNLTILSIVILFAIRCILSEMLLSIHLKIRFAKDTIIEAIMCGLFIFICSSFNAVISCILYGSCYIFYLIYKKKTILNYSVKICKIIKDKNRKGG